VYLNINRENILPTAVLLDFEGGLLLFLEGKGIDYIKEAMHRYGQTFSNLMASTRLHPINRFVFWLFKPELLSKVFM